MPTTNETGAPKMESLLTPDLEAPAAPAAKSAAPAQETLRRWWGAFRNEPRMKWPRRIAGLGTVLGVILVGIWAGVTLFPRPQPDFSNDDLGEVLEFTLLTDDFNKLPLQERLRLLKELVARMKSMSEDDAPIMAAFAASIKNEMRKQIEKNVKKLAADMVDDFAQRYSSVPPSDAPRFLDDSIIEFTHLMEDIAGEKSPLPTKDDERLAAIKQQAKRDEAKLREDKSRMTAERAARFFEFIHDPNGDVADPVQRGRSAKFMRDMTRHLRGQEPATGKPANGPG
ncbi:MAG: hypothetical protein AB7G11_13360 [Phycisphaerales bacterium]